MNSPVRQVLPRATGRLTPLASPATGTSRRPVPDAAGNAVRHATAKAPDGAGAIGAAGHVVAPALPADGPGFLFRRMLTARSFSPAQKCAADSPFHGPRSVTWDCYPAAQDDSAAIVYSAAGRVRIFLPAPDQGTRLLDRTRGDRHRRTDLRRAAVARSGFGRGVSLSFEPAPQIPEPDQLFVRRSDVLQAAVVGMAASAPRICRGIVARALP